MDFYSGDEVTQPDVVDSAEVEMVEQSEGS